jgi:uncharacterized membrane protein
VSAPRRRRHPWIAPALVVLVAIESVFLLQVVGYAYAQIGISAHAMLVLLALSIVTSVLDVPVARLGPRRQRVRRRIDVFGTSYVVPVDEEQPGTLIAVNVGGAVIPVGIAVRLLLATGTWIPAAVATVVVAAVIHRVARFQEGAGIVVPALLPPVAAAAMALALGGHQVATVAYVSGTLGTLAGADLLNLPRVRALGGGLVSIGGAGTFDGVFLSGLGAVLIATLA